MNQSLLKRTCAELAGTYCLVTAGCGAIMVDAQTGELGHIGVSLTFGIVILVMIAALGHISGAHFNPAVTIAFALTRHFPWREVGAYVTGQLIGAVLGALTLQLIIGDIANLGVTSPSGTVSQTFGIEVLLTIVLMLVITSVATDTRAAGNSAALAIGLTVALDALWGGPISGASMNPARSIGPALVAGIWADQWLYVLAPIAGACIGALLYQYLRS